MEQSIDQSAQESLEGLLNWANLKALTYFVMKQPTTQRVYKDYANAVDSYLAAFKKEYPSLLDYIAAQETLIRAHVSGKGYQVNDNIIDIDDVAATIQRLNDQIYGQTDHGFYDRDKFAELFVLRVPALVQLITDNINALPPRAAPAAPQPSPG